MRRSVSRRTASRASRATGAGASGRTSASRAARARDLTATGLQVDADALSQLSSPALAWVDANHYVAVLSVTGETATIHDPNRPVAETISTADLLARSQGILLTLSR
ncbi:MAG: hypothetical protein C4343_04960 [Chloroflexota bacterium]